MGDCLGVWYFSCSPSTLNSGVSQPPVGIGGGLLSGNEGADNSDNSLVDEAAEGAYGYPEDKNWLLVLD